MKTAPTLLLADWIAPMDRALVRHAAMLIDGTTIAEVGSADELRHQYPHAETITWPDSILVPGLVNAHVHCELSGDVIDPVGSASADRLFMASPGKENNRSAEADPTQTISTGDRFVAWLKRVIAAAPVDATARQARAAENTRESIRQCLQFGVTTIGDISRHCGVTRQAIAQSPLRAVSFGEITAMAQRRGMLDENIKLATDTTHASEKMRIGVTPHAPYSVEIPAYQRCVQLGLPIATHLAETPDEAEFLADYTGPLRDLWDWLGFWDDAVPTFAGGPIRLAQSVGLLHAAAVLAHVNYCDDAELDILAAGNASVVYCPRTHRFFGHAPHRWRDMLARGINVAVGTDSRASSPDLNLLDDLRLLRQIAPDMPAQTLWQLATTRAAAALGLSGTVGSLTPGKQADVLVFPADGNDPLEAILQSPSMVPRAVWIGGRLIH